MIPNPLTLSSFISFYVIIWNVQTQLFNTFVAKLT